MFYDNTQDTRTLRLRIHVEALQCFSPQQRDIMGARAKLLGSGYVCVGTPYAISERALAVPRCRAPHDYSPFHLPDRARARKAATWSTRGSVLCSGANTVALLGAVLRHERGAELDAARGRAPAQPLQPGVAAALAARHVHIHARTPRRGRAPSRCGYSPMPATNVLAAQARGQEGVVNCQGESVPAGLHAAPTLARIPSAGPAAAGPPRDRARARAGCARRGRTLRTTCARAAARWCGRWRARRRRRRAQRGPAPRRRARARTGGAPTCPTRPSGASTSAATCPLPWSTAA